MLMLAAVATGIDWVPLANYGIQIVGYAVPILAPYLIAELVITLRKNRQAALANALAARSAQISAIADRAADFVGHAAETKIAQQGPSSTGNQRLDAFVNFMVGQAEGVLKEQGVDITTPDGQQKLARMALARGIGIDPKT